MMTIDEAIEQYKHIAYNYESVGNTEDAMETRQIAEWLSLLKVYTDTGMAKEVQRARHEMHGWQLEWKREMERRKELETENVKLRKLIGAYHEYCLCNQYSKKSAHQLITEIEDMICELGIEVD